MCACVLYDVVLFLLFFSPILSSSLQPTFWCHFRHFVLKTQSIDFLPALPKQTYNIEILGICHFFRFTTFSLNVIFMKFPMQFCIVAARIQQTSDFFFAVAFCACNRMSLLISVGCLYFIHICGLVVGRYEQEEKIKQRTFSLVAIWFFSTSNAYVKYVKINDFMILFSVQHFGIKIYLEKRLNRMSQTMPN